MYDWPTHPPCWLQKLTKPTHLTCIQNRRAQHGSSLRQVGRLRRSCTSNDNHALHHDLYLQGWKKTGKWKNDPHLQAPHAVHRPVLDLSHLSKKHRWSLMSFSLSGLLGGTSCSDSVWPPGFLLRPTLLEFDPGRFVWPSCPLVGTASIEDLTENW